MLSKRNPSTRKEGILGADTTRDRVLGLIASAGPITASELAHELGVTPAGVRRHLSALTVANLIAEHEIAGGLPLGRGRLVMSYVATTSGQTSLTTAYSSVAVDAVAFMRERGQLDEFVNAQVAELESELAAAVPEHGTLMERVQALADALAVKGFATSVRPGPG